jgi:ribosomal protein S18 acetylase RimI-like enzyme
MVARPSEMGVLARGTLWALEPDAGLPPCYEARIPTTFAELGEKSIPDLIDATPYVDPDTIRGRLTGRRRCVALLTDGAVAAYGWISYGAERVDELDRTLEFASDEAYIWDCHTRPALRGQGCYSALLSECIYLLHAEGTPRIWIGANLDNIPSIKGFANAGFGRVVDLTLYRWGRVTFAYTRSAPAAPPHLVRAARQAISEPYEQQFGPIIAGVKR